MDFLDKGFLQLENENMTFHDGVGYGMKKRFHAERDEYKKSYLRRIQKSLLFQGHESSFYIKFLQKRLETLPNPWIQHLKLETLPEGVMDSKLLSITSEFLMKDL